MLDLPLTVFCRSVIFPFSFHHLPFALYWIERVAILHVRFGLFLVAEIALIDRALVIDDETFFSGHAVFFGEGNERVAEHHVSVDDVIAFGAGGFALLGQYPEQISGVRRYIFWLCADGTLGAGERDIQQTQHDFAVALHDRD